MTGWSSPRAASRRAISSAVMRGSASSMSSGLPGAMEEMIYARIVMPKKVGMAISRRFKTYFVFMAASLLSPPPGPGPVGAAPGQGRMISSSMQAMSLRSRATAVSVSRARRASRMRSWEVVSVRLLFSQELV